MKQVFTFSTIAAPAKGLYTDKGSKFIGYIFPLCTEDELKTILKSLRSEHAGARHFCYSYRLGKTEFTDRSNDDGEPSGTAGKPIFNQILSAGLSNVAIVVVRYFGGTLLGTTGLIKAYKTAAKLSIEEAEIIEKEITISHKVNIPYRIYNEFMSLIKKYDIHSETNSSSDAETSFEIEIPIRIKDEFLIDLNHLTNS